jgi:hypothetical protein
MQAKRGGYRGIPKPKLPSHLKRVHVTGRIQKWMLDQLKEQGEVGAVLEGILINAGFKYRESPSHHQKKEQNPVALD